MSGVESERSETEFRAPTDGGDLVGWLTEGPESAPPALLMHGGPGLSDYLGSLADELQGLFPIARYQQRGLAPSVQTGERDVQRHVEDAAAVLDTLGWERAIVIGHSWGGHLAMHFAVAHEERLQALVSIDPLCAIGDGGLAEFVERLASQVPAERRPRYDELAAIESPTAAERDESFRMLWPYYFGDPDNAAIFPGFRYDTKSGATWESIKAHFADGALELGLPAVKVPFLLIHGDSSPLPIAHAERTIAVTPNARLAVGRGLGHWPWLEKPGFVRAEVERFLSEWS